MVRWTEGVRREVLPNGLTLLAQRIPDAPAVAVVSSVRAGFFDEPDRLAGVSHVLEHMLFKGTPTRGVGDISRETRAAGGSLNAGTGYDHTSYLTVLPPASLRVGLELQSDALRRSLLDSEELRRELIVILEEAKRKLDSPAAVAGESLHALLFDTHRIRRWRIGTESQLGQVTRADVAEFHRRYYVPGEIVVAMTGELPPDEACAAAREYFEDWESTPADRDRSPAEPFRKAVRARTIRGDVTRADLTLGWRSVDRLHPDAIPLDLAAMVLSGGRSSWLYQRVRVPGAMTAVSASNFTPREVGVFSIGGELDPALLGDALSGIAECVTRLREEGPTPIDLARVSTLLQASWARRLEAAEGRASALAAAEMDGDYRLLDEDYARLLSTDLEAIQRVAQEWLDPAGIAGVAYLPEGEGEDLSEGWLQEAFSKPVRRSDVKTVGPPDGKTAVGSGDRSELLSKVSASRPSGRRTGCRHVALPGVDLLLHHKPGVPLISLGLYQRRHRQETLADAGLTALAVRSAVRGAGELDAAGLGLAFERLGGVLGTSVGSEWFGFATSVLSPYGQEAARLLELVFRDPRLEPDEILREHKTLLDRVIQDADDMSRYPVELAFRARFGPAGYGLPTFGIPESVQQLSVDLVRGWHRSVLAAGSRRPVLVAAGDLDPDRFGDEVAGIFERYPGRTEDWGAIGGEPPAVYSPVIAEDRAKRQTALALLFPGPTRRSVERSAAEVWAAIAGGMGGRLFGALRDRMSLAYVVRASVWQRSGAGGLLGYLATSPEREAEAREALHAELRRFRDVAVEPDELERAIRYLSGQILIGRQTVGAVAFEIAEAWLSLGETGLEELDDPLAGIRAVTASAVQSVAEQGFAPHRGVEGVIRGHAVAAMFRPHG